MSVYLLKNGIILFVVFKKDFVLILLFFGIGKNLCFVLEKNDIIFFVLIESCFIKYVFVKVCLLFVRVGLCMLKYIYFCFCFFVEVYKYIIVLKIFKYVLRCKLCIK